MLKMKGFLFVALAVLVIALAVVPATILAATRSKNGLVLSYPDGATCIVGSDKVSVTSSSLTLNAVQFDFFGATNAAGPLTHITTIVDNASPFEVTVPYDQQFSIFAVFVANLDSNLKPIAGQKVSAQWICTFAEPTATSTPVPPTPTPEPPTPTPDMPGQGCTPGYWKQPHHIDSWESYNPGDSYATIFGRTPSFGDITLLEALELGGGGENALARHAAAALLNASHSSVNYVYSVAEVISMVQAAYDTGDFETTKDLFDAANNAGCPLN